MPWRCSPTRPSRKTSALSSIQPSSNSPEKFMKATNLILIAAVACLFAGAQAETLRYNSSPRGSMMKIEGTSTIHDWTVECPVIGGYIELESNFPLNPAKEPPKDLKVKPKAEIFIFARQL